MDDYFGYVALFISTVAVGFSIIKFKRESKIQVQADLVSTLTKIIDIIKNETVHEYREILRKNQQLYNIRNNDSELLPKIDDDVEKIARNVAIAYDKLGFILKHDVDLEKRVLEWHGDDIEEMWFVLEPLIVKKWRIRNKKYAIEFERLARKAISQK